jgi:hypothetical protein
MRGKDVSAGRDLDQQLGSTPVMRAREGVAVTGRTCPTVLLSPGQIVTTNDDSRKQRCRYLTHVGKGFTRTLERCTAEVAQADAEIALCTHHLGKALELLTRLGLGQLRQAA